MQWWWSFLIAVLNKLRYLLRNTYYVTRVQKIFFYNTFWNIFVSYYVETKTYVPHRIINFFTIFILHFKFAIKVKLKTDLSICSLPPNFYMPWSVSLLFSLCPSPFLSQYRKCIQWLSQSFHPFCSCSCTLRTNTASKSTPPGGTGARRRVLLQLRCTTSWNSRFAVTWSKRVA